MDSMVDSSMRIVDLMHANNQSHRDLQMPKDGRKNQSKDKHCSSFFNMLLDVAGEGEAFAKKESVAISLHDKCGAGKSVNEIHTDSLSCPENSAILSSVWPTPSSIDPVMVASKRSLDEKLKSQETALISSTVKELSDDPLVQLSMLRAMQNQKVTPDMLRKNMEEREAARAGTTQQRPSKKRKAKHTRTVLTSQQEVVPQTSIEVAQTSIEVAHQRVCQPMRSDPESTALHPTNSLLSSQRDSKAGAVTSLEELRTVLANAMTVLKNTPSSHGLEVPQLIELNAAQRARVIQQSILLSLQPQVPPPQELFHQQQVLSAFLLAAWGRHADVSASSCSLLGNLLPHLVPSPQQLGGTQQEQEATDRKINSSEPAASSNGKNAGRFVEPSNGVPTCSLSGNHPIKGKHTDMSTSDDPLNTEFIRIPCRARRMPADHNFKTAYFRMPRETTKVVHGQDLKCSHPSCGASGVKFRYCKVCDIPVAKRAFWLKHRHEEGRQERVPPRDVVDVDADRRLLSSSSSSSSSSRLPAEEDDPPPIPRSIRCFSHRSPTSEAIRMSPQTIPPFLHGESESDLSTGAHRCRRCRHPQEGGPNPPVTTTTTTGGETKGKANQRLEDDDDNNKEDPTITRGRGIMAVSTSTATTTTHDHHHQHQHHHNRRPMKDSPQRRMELWKNLLRQRPMPPHDNEEAMSQWLMKVLAVSDVTTPLQHDHGNDHDHDDHYHCCCCFSS